MACHTRTDEMRDGRSDAEPVDHDGRVEKASGHDRGTVERNERGRFVGSGNPRGRPRKRQPKADPPGCLGDALAREMLKPITVRRHGKLQKTTAIEAVASKFIHEMLSTSGMSFVRSVAAVDKMGGFAKVAEIYDNAKYAEDATGPWTAELEAMFKVMEGQYEDRQDEVVTQPPLPDA